MLSFILSLFDEEERLDDVVEDLDPLFEDGL
jgi:hypothetical protein